MNFYFAGYYLIKLKETEFDTVPSKKIYTCSNCINDSLFDVWSLSWTKFSTRDLNEAFDNFSLTREKIKQVQNWSDEKFNNQEIGWLGIFNDLVNAQEYKNKFFDASDKNIKTLAIYFNESERKTYLEEFKPEIKEQSYNGIGENLLKQIEENEEGQTIGYDLVGAEYDGTLHTFYCHDMAAELKSKFGLEINEYGLIKELKDEDSLIKYMNNEETGCEPVPWFYVKVKMFD